MGVGIAEVLVRLNASGARAFRDGVFQEKEWFRHAVANVPITIEFPWEGVAGVADESLAECTWCLGKRPWSEMTVEGPRFWCSHCWARRERNRAV